LLSKSGHHFFEKVSTVTVKDAIDARNFPFDVQDWTFGFYLQEVNKTWSTPPNRKLVLMRDQIDNDGPDGWWREREGFNSILCPVLYGLDGNQALADWTLYAVQFPHGEYHNRKKSKGRRGTTHTTLSLGTSWGASIHSTIYLARDPTYFLVNFMLVLLFIEMLAVVSFVDNEHGNTSSYNLTLLLAAIALKFSSAADVPQLPYLTVLDKSMVLCYFVIASVMLVQLWPHLNALLHGHGHGQESEEFAYAAEETVVHMKVALATILGANAFLIGSAWRERSSTIRSHHLTVCEKPPSGAKKIWRDKAIKTPATLSGTSGPRQVAVPGSFI
jgi:hypothetical protein